MKHIESALYDAKIPGVVPQRQDRQTIKIIIPKYPFANYPTYPTIDLLFRPTVEARQALIASAHGQAEDARVQIRKTFQVSVKRGKYKKHSESLDEVRLRSSYLYQEYRNVDCTSSSKN